MKVWVPLKADDAKYHTIKRKFMLSKKRDKVVPVLN
jgi:hypothetical protein